MSSLLRSGSAGRGSDPSYVMSLDDAKAQEIYDKFDTYSPLEQRTLGNTLRNWAEQKVAQEQQERFKELETIYEDVGAWWKESGGDPMDDEIVYGAANRKFIATQLGTTAREVGDLYPHERDKWFLQNFQKKPKDDTEAFNMIRESMASRKKVEEAYDMITGDVALALFDQIDKGQPVDVPTLINKWKTENAETVASLPEDWEVNTLKAAGEYFTDTERMLREQGPTLQKLYAHLVKATGRKVEGAPENDPQTVEEVNALLDELAKLPPEVRQRGYGAILMAAKRQGMDEKGFFEMAAEAWPRSLNAIKTLGFTAQETEIEERVRLLESGKTVYRDPLTGGLAGQSSAALMGASGQAVRQGEPVPEEERQQMLAEAKTELERFQVLREVRDLADNRFDPVRSNLKGGIGKIAQDIFLLGPQSFVYTGMAAIPVAGPLLSGAAIYSDEYNQLRLEGFTSQQSKALAAVSAPIQTFFEVAGAKLLFGRYQWYKDLVRKLVNPARFTRTAQGTVSFFGKVVGENITEGLQDLTTPVVQDFANRLNEEIPDVDWNQTFTQWYDSRLEVFAATLMPVIGGHTVEMFTDGKRFSSAERREKLFYGPLGINQKEKRYIEDGTTPEERRQRSIEVLQAMPKERVKSAQDALAQQSQTAAVTQQDATTPTLEAQKDANGRVTYIVRDEGGKEVYRTNKQDAAEEAYILATAKSTAAQFSNDRIIVQELVSQWESADPNNVARTGQTENAQQVLDRLTAENNTAQIEILHRRIAQSPMAGTPYDQIQILGEATVEDVGNMVFRGVITLNESSRPQDAREEMHHVAVRRALGTNRVTLDQLREWLAASESVLETKLARDTQDDIVESLAIVQRAYEDGQIDAGRETQLPPSFVDYIKRMIAAFAEVLKRAVALREAFAAGALPQEYEAFLAETTGVSQQEVVDRARERTEQEVGATQNYSISAKMDASYQDMLTAFPDAADIIEQKRAFAEDQQTFNSIPLGMPTLGFQFDRSFHLTKLLRRVLDNFDPIMWSVALRNIQSRENPSDKFWAERAKTYEGKINRSTNAMRYMWGVLSDLTASLPEVTARDLREDKMTDPWRVLKKHFAGGEAKDINAIIGEMRDVVRGGVDPENIRSSMRDVLNTAEVLRDFMDIDQDLMDELFTIVHGRNEEQQLQAEQEFMEESTNPEFFDVEQKGNATISRRIELEGEPENYSIGLRPDFISQVSDRDDASRVGTAKLGTDKVPVDTPQTSNISGDMVPEDLLAKQMAKVDYAHLPESIRKEKDPKKKRRKLINWFKKNLLALHDAFPEEFRARATHWYDGANRIARDFSQRFNATVEQASGVIAVFSPQKDWFMNVAQAMQFMELWTTSQDVVLSEETVRAEVEDIIEAATAPQRQKRKKAPNETKEQAAERKAYNQQLDQKAKDERRKTLDQIIGKTIRELDDQPYLQGWAIRVLAQVTFGRNYRNISPEGDMLGMATNDDGALAKNGWGSINEIEKAVRIMKDGSLANISDNLGNEHKVRNFYNNIVAPNSGFGDATIDTHAVAAAHLMPYGAKATEVQHNFGSGMNNSDAMGVSGLYHVYLDAYREAAKERGLQPRQLQSITWEAIRLVYPAANKNAATLAKAAETWNNLSDGRARNSLVGGTIPSPVWAGTGDGAESQSLAGATEGDGQGSDAGRSLRSGDRSDGRRGVDNYSISTQSEIDRVQAAMGALDRSPLSRIKVYEKMQERFLRVMADNRETLSAMDGDLSQVRRTQILQALGELDGIISALPAEIRSKIGGYTQLAKVDPMDVFKGDQKVSEVRGMSGAIISAWMREGLNIGEAQKKTELPAGYRAERNLDPARADRAIADVFIQRINRINEVLENFLRDEYNDAAVELFKRAKPQRSGAGEKPKGKLGADVHELFDTLKEATEWSSEEAQAWADGQWARIESGELSPYQEAHAALASQVVPLFADWANADSTQRAAAVTMGKDILDRAYKGEQQRILAMRQKRGYDRADLSDDAGVAAEDDKARQIALKKENSLPSKFESGMLNLLNFDQVLRYVFGNDSKVARQISDRQRKADNAKSDDIAALSDQWDTFLSILGGGQMEGQRLLFDLSRMNEEIDGVPYSQNQLIAISMMWMQPKGRQHMEGFMDSDGQPAGKWHYNQDFVNKAEKLLRPEAKAIRQYLLRKYDEEYDAINKVYRKVYGMNLPKNQFYSPLVVESINAPAQAGIDPVTGSVFAAGANSPSALRSRGGAIAQPVFRDAVQTYFGHMLQMAHWKAYAEFSSEVSALLGHRDTRNVVKGKAGEQAATVLNNWLDYFRKGGNKDAANHLAINQWINRITGNFAAISLFGRVSTLALQVTQLGAASAKMPVGAYLSRFGKLMSGRLGWTTALDSDYIQRRIKDMPPAVALAMQGLRAEKPSAIRNAARWLGQHLSGFDGFFTAGTYAIVYDYQLSQARQNGMGGQEAADYAREATERIVDEIAQPTRAGARSIYELNSTNPVARAVWAFSSESRKNMGLLMASGAVGGKRNFGKALTYVLLLNGLVGIVIRNAFRDMRDEDDDEIFDEKNWGWKRLAAQFISDPIYGIPVVGETIEGAIYAALGVYQPSGPVFDVARGVPAAKRMLTQYPAEVLEGEAEFRDIVADVNRILATAGLFNSTIAGAASISNLAKDVFEIGDNALDDE